MYVVLCLCYLIGGKFFVLFASSVFNVTEGTVCYSSIRYAAKRYARRCNLKHNICITRPYARGQFNVVGRDGMLFISPSVGVERCQ